MCGRYSLGKTDHLDWGRFGVAPNPCLEPHWNIAPGTDVLAIRDSRDGREATWLRWGLIPHWAKDPGIGNRHVNARAESADEKPAFRDAFRSRRCILPADGFYEWQAIPGQKRKQPWRVESKDGAIFALGALWESWRAPGGETRETCTVLTVPVNDALRHIHDRMPVLVAPADYGEWLSLGSAMDVVKALCRPAPDDLLDAWRVSLAINAAANDGASLAAPL